MANTPRSQKNTSSNQREEAQQPISVSKAMESQIRSLHRAFVDRQGGADNATADKFVEFVSKQAGGRNLLSKINASNIKVYFDNIQEQGTTLSTITQHTNYFRHVGASQADDLDRGYAVIKSSLEAFPGKWDDFVREHHLSFSTSPRGIAITEYAQSRTDIRSVGDLHAAWNGFLAKENLNHDNLNNALSDLPTTNTEQVMVRAIFEKIRTKISSDTRGSFDEMVGSLDAYSHIQSVDDMVTAMYQWLDHHPDQRDTVESVVIRNRDIYQAYQRLGGTGHLQGDFSQWDSSLRQLIDHNSSLAAASSYEGSAEYIQDNITKSQQMLTVLSPTIVSLTKQYPLDDATLKQHVSGYQERFDDLTTKLTLATQKAAEDGVVGLRAKEQKQTLNREIELLRRKAWVESIRPQDERLAGLLAQGPGLDFDFSKLSKEDQCYLGWACARDRIENRDESSNLYSLDRDRYGAFVREMFDPNQTHITIPTNEGEQISVPVKDKGFLAGGVHPSHLNFKKIEDFKHLGFGVDVVVTNENEEALSTMLPGLFQNINGQQISPSYRVRIIDQNTGEVDEGYLMNVGYSGDEVTHRGDAIDPATMQDQWMLFDFPPTKAGRKYPDPEIIRKGRNLGSTTDVERTYDIQPLEKQLTLTGDSLDQLALGWALGDRMNHRQYPEQSLDSSWEDMMDAARAPDPENYIDSYTREQQQVDDGIDSAQEIQSAFLDSFRQTIKAPDGTMDSITSLDDIVGQTLWVQHGQTLIPPRDGTLPYRIKLSIDDIDTTANTITLSMHGTDNPIQDIEGASYTLPLESKTLRKLTEGTNDKSLYMLPSFSGDNMHAYVHKMNQAGVIDQESSTLFGGLELTKKGFKRTSDDREVAYFSETKTIPDPNDDNKTVKVPLSFSVTRSGDNEFVIKNHDIRYKRTVDLPTLMIFIGERNLQAMTGDEKKNFEQRTHHPDHYELKGDKRQPRQSFVGGLYGIANLWSFGKEMIQKAKDGMENYSKKQTEDMSEVLLGKYGLYGKLGKTFGFIPAVKDAFNNMHGDYIQERDKKTFDLISSYKDYLAQNPDGEYVADKEVLGIIKDAKKGKIPTKRRSVLFAAGAYLYMLEEQGDPYGTALREFRGSGLWVRVLCGEAHYQNYLLKAEEARLKLEADPTNINLQEAYAEMEAKYIHMAIADNTSYKTFFSKKFSDAVIGAKRKGNDQERIDKTANIFGGQKDFDLNETLFGVKIRNGDIGKTIGHLKAMAMTAQSDAQIHKVRLYLLELMLSGMVLYQTKDSTKDILAGIAAKMGFIPGTWVRDANHPQKLHTLLDYITGGNFSAKTTYSNTTFQRLNYGENISTFHKNFKGWANSGDGTKVSEFLTLMDVNKQPNKNLLSILGRYHEGERNIEGPTTGTYTNEEHIALLQDVKDGIMNNSIAGADRDLQNKHLFKAPLAIPNSVISGQLGPDRQGRLESGNNKETAMKEQFWKSLASSIPAKRMPHSEKFFIEKFTALITGVTDSSFMRQALVSAQYHLKQGQKSIAKTILQDTMTVLPINKRMHDISKDNNPIKQVLDRYVDFFVENLGSMDETQLLRSVNMSGGLMPGDSSFAKPYIPGRDWDKPRGEIPAGSLNVDIYNLRQSLKRDGEPWTYFGGDSRNSASDSSDTATKVRKLYKNAPPIHNPEEYLKNTTTNDSRNDTPVINLDNYTQEELARAFAEKQEQEEDDYHYRDAV